MNSDNKGTHKISMRLGQNKSASGKNLIYAGELLVKALKKGNKVLSCGNGGSASDAQHFTAELLGRFKTDRPPLPAICLNCNSSVLTAIANDYGYEKVFSRQIEAFGSSGDALIALSTSGNSRNIIEAIRVALQKEMVVIGFTGIDGGDMKEFCHVCIRAPEITTPKIQEWHIKALHLLCAQIEGEIFCKK